MQEVFSPVVMDSWFSRLDSRVKLVSLIGFLVISTTLNSLELLSTAVIFLLIHSAWVRVPFSFLAKRTLWILPFSGVLVLFFPFITPGFTFWEFHNGVFTLIATIEGIKKAVLLSLRLLAAVLAISLLTGTTPFRSLMTGLRLLYLPAIFVLLMEFMVRYIFVLSDELQRMRTAQRARGFQKGGSLINLKTFRALGQLIGVLFIRSWERGERVYQAMLARGLTWKEGKATFKQPLSKIDILWGASLLAVGAGLRLLERRGNIW